MLQKRKIAICGLGYVGLPLCIRFAEAGLEVTGLDIDELKVKKLNNGSSYIKHIESSVIQNLMGSKQLRASNDFSLVSKVEAIVICVPTPLGQHREPDISYVISTGKTISPYLKRLPDEKRPIVVLESTTYPGTTDEELRKILEEESGLTAGKDFHLAYSPEREDPGRNNYTVQSIPKIIGGYTNNCLKRCEELYSHAIDNLYPVSSTKVAEATKLMENIFRSVNIALVNELKIIYEAMGINIWEVIDAAATKPFGYMPFYPGPGLGGHCIPIDPFYLTWKAKEYDKNSKFIELAGEINTAMPFYVVSQVYRALNEKSKSINGSKILILGIAYKANVDDCRESPSFKIWEVLEGLGCQVYFNDPNVNEINYIRDYPNLYGKKSVNIEDNYDLLLITTDHDDYKKINFDKFSCPVVDSRNIAKGSNVHKA